MIKEVYRVKHSYKLEPDPDGDGWVYETKLIGYYLSLEEAKDIVEQYKCLEGFCDYPNDFMVDKIEIKCDDQEAMRLVSEKRKIIYSLEHEYEIVQNGEIYDMQTFFGIYISKQKAIKEMKRLQKTPEYQEHKEGFGVYEQPIGLSGWCEGFCHN